MLDELESRIKAVLRDAGFIASGTQFTIDSIAELDGDPNTVTVHYTIDARSAVLFALRHEGFWVVSYRLLSQQLLTNLLGKLRTTALTYNDDPVELTSVQVSHVLWPNEIADHHRDWMWVFRILFDEASDIGVPEMLLVSWRPDPGELDYWFVDSEGLNVLAVFEIECQPPDGQNDAASVAYFHQTFAGQLRQFCDDVLRPKLGSSNWTFFAEASSISIGIDWEIQTAPEAEELQELAEKTGTRLRQFADQRLRLFLPSGWSISVIAKGPAV